MRVCLRDLTIEITDACPNRCLFCSSAVCAETRHRFLSAEIALRVVEQGRALGLSQVSLSGGEPLLHPEIVRIVTGIRELDLQPVVYTTGITLGRNCEESEEWDRFGSVAPLLVFNIQSADPRVHDLLANRPGAFAMTVASLKCAIDRNLRTEVHIVPLRHNLETIPDTVEWLAQLGVRRVSFLRLVPQGNAREHREELELPKVEAARLRSILASVSQKHGAGISIRLGIPFSTVLGAARHCVAGETKLLIRPDGTAFPCEAFKDPQLADFALGNVHNLALGEILGRSRGLVRLGELKSSDALLDPCPAQLLYR